jgi:hypothetical protein
MDKEEAKKVPFKTLVKKHPNGSLERKIFIGNTEVDYSIDITSFMEARKMGPAYESAIKADIVKHFTECVSDVLGRKVTYAEVLAATKSGWI